MSVSNSLVAGQNFNPEDVKEKISETVKLITLQMVSALMLALQDKLDFKRFAEKHIRPQIENEISLCDQKTQMVFQKLLFVTLKHVNENSPPMQMTFVKINDVIENGTPLFLGSFVLPAAKILIEKLESQKLDVNEVFALNI